MRRQLREEEESGDSMKSLRWDGATLRKASSNHPMLTVVDCFHSDNVYSGVVQAYGDGHFHP